MEPYYVSGPKVVHLVATGGADLDWVEKTSVTSGVSMSVTPKAEGGVGRETTTSSPDLSDPTAALRQLGAAVRKVEPHLVEVADASLSERDWFELVGPAWFGVLHRDSGGGGAEIATWFFEVPLPDLGVAYWVVLTGSPENLRERWTGAAYQNRSGSGTDSVFDVLRRVAAGQPPADESDEKWFFSAVSGMSGMAQSRTEVRTIAEVMHVRTMDGSGYTTRDSDQLPIVKVVAASPLFVERHREARLDAAEEGPEQEAGPSRWQRLLRWLGLTTPPTT